MSTSTTEHQFDHPRTDEHPQPKRQLLKKVRSMQRVGKRERTRRPSLIAGTMLVLPIALGFFGLQSTSADGQQIIVENRIAQTIQTETLRQVPDSADQTAVENNSNTPASTYGSDSESQSNSASAALLANETQIAPYGSTSYEIAPLDLPAFLQDVDGFSQFLAALHHADTRLTWDDGEIMLDHRGMRSKAAVSINRQDGTYVSMNLPADMTCADVRDVTISCCIRATDPEAALDAAKRLFSIDNLKKSTCYFGAPDSEMQPYEAREGLSFELFHNEAIQWRIDGSLHQIDTLDGAYAYDVILSLKPYRSLVA